MNIASISGLIASAAGAPLAQTKGSETERAGQESAGQQRHIESGAKADRSAGIGAAGEDSAADADRDADGRLPWQLALGKPEDGADALGDDALRQCRDPKGDSGNSLDLCG